MTDAATEPSGTPDDVASAGGPLRGLTVVELSHVMAGPTCGLMLADMGADVIKVERIPDGDDVRRFTPPSVGDVSAAFLVMNRNKRGIALHLKTDSGKAVLRRLLRKADIVVENYRTGAMERMGFGYETLRADNPGLIYCAISGFGRTGPYADRGGFDLIAQGMSGLMSITGEGPGRPPVKVGPPITDIVAGLLGCIGILAALRHREATGEGQMLDTSLFEAGIIQTFWQSAICFASGKAPTPMGSAHPLSAPYQAFPTADRWITVGAANQTNWLRLLKVLDLPALAEDSRYRTNADRMRNLPELAEELAAIFRSQPSAHWLQCLADAGVPAGPVLDIKEMQEHEQALAREMVVDAVHVGAGAMKTLGIPIKFSTTPGSVRRGAPAFGQHTECVLREMGFSDDEIRRMADEGAIALGG